MFNPTRNSIVQTCVTVTLESFDVKVIYMMLRIKDMMIFFNHELYVNVQLWQMDQSFLPPVFRFQGLGAHRRSWSLSHECKIGWWACSHLDKSWSGPLRGRGQRKAKIGNVCPFLWPTPQLWTHPLSTILPSISARFALSGTTQGWVPRRDLSQELLSRKFGSFHSGHCSYTG